VSAPSLADGDAVPPDEVVIRGGESTINTMVKSALSHWDSCLDEGREPEYALSAEYRLGCTGREIARQAGDPIPRYRLMRQAIVRDIATAGFPVVHDGRVGHALIKIDAQSDDDLEGLVGELNGAFAPPEPNPGWRPDV
jgi:hypothetical protein